MGKHIHAELMAQYAKDAMKTDKPWERWEFFSVTDAQWRNFHCPPVWSEVVQYRRKPKTSRELYEALDDLLEQCTAECGDPEDYIAALKRGNEVIAKAKGEYAANTADKHRKGCGEGGE